MLGGAAFLADSVLTPAVSISSAVEGLKTLPALEHLFTENKDLTMMITAVIIIVRSLFSVNRCSNAGSVFRPSTADEIDTAGVSTESARKAAPPSMAGMTSHAPYLRINEYRAKMVLQKRTSKHPNSHHT